MNESCLMWHANFWNYVWWQCGNQNDLSVINVAAIIMANDY